MDKTQIATVRKIVETHGSSVIERTSAVMNARERARFAAIKRKLDLNELTQKRTLLMDTLNGVQARQKVRLTNCSKETPGPVSTRSPLTWIRVGSLRYSNQSHHG